MEKLSEWLDVMLGEIARKQGEAAVSAAEQQRRDQQRETSMPDTSPAAPTTSPTAERR
jgi:hypothetical protein